MHSGAKQRQLLLPLLPAGRVPDAPFITGSLSPERLGYSRSKAEKRTENLTQNGLREGGGSRDIHPIGYDSHHKEFGF